MKKLFILIPLLLVMHLAAKDTATEITTDTLSQKTVLSATYFHTTYRCHTCNTIEALAREAINENFADKLENNTVVFSSVNIDEEENKHFVDEFKLYTKSLIISGTDKDGEYHWKNLDQVWKLVHKPDEYKEYVTKEVTAFMEKLNK